MRQFKTIQPTRPPLLAIQIREGDGTVYPAQVLQEDDLLLVWVLWDGTLRLEEEGTHELNAYMEAGSSLRQAIHKTLEPMTTPKATIQIEAVEVTPLEVEQRGQTSVPRAVVIAGETYLSIAEAAERLGYAHKSVLTRRRAGEYRRSLKVNDAWYIHEDDVANAQKRVKTSTASSPRPVKKSATVKTTKPATARKTAAAQHVVAPLTINIKGVPHVLLAEAARQLGWGYTKMTKTYKDTPYPVAVKDCGNWYVPENVIAPLLEQKARRAAAHRYNVYGLGRHLGYTAKVTYEVGCLAWVDGNNDALDDAFIVELNQHLDAGRTLRSAVFLTFTCKLFRVKKLKKVA